MGAESRRALAYAAALAAFTLCVFAPGQVYFHNAGEFSFSFLAVLAWLLPLFLLGWGLGLAAAWWGPEPRRVAASALLLGGGVAAWLQCSVLLWDLGPLDGRPLDWTHQVFPWALDSATWFVALVGAWWGRRWLVARTRNAAGALLALQVLTLATLAGTVGTEKGPLGDWVVDTSQRVQFSRGRNVVVLLLDTFQSDAFARMLQREPALAERLDGFTFHRDALGGFPSTYPSVPLVLTGRVYDNRQPIRTFVDEAFRSASALPLALRRAGYRVEFYPMVDQSVSLDGSNVSNVQRRMGMSRSEVYPLAAAALFRAAPMPAKRLLFDWVSAVQSFSGLQGNLGFLRELETEARVGGTEPTFKFIHLPGAHAPYVLDEHLAAGPEREGLEAYERHARGALELALRFMDRVKALGIFEDSLWVIAGDHGHSHLGQLEQATPLLLTRLPGGHGKLVTSDAPVSLGDVPASVAAALHVEFAPAPETLPVLTAPVPPNRVRRYMHYTWTHDHWMSEFLGPMEEFLVAGPARAPGAWRASGLRCDRGSCERPNPYVLGSELFFGETRAVHRFGEGRELRSSGLSTLPGPAGVMDRDSAQFEFPLPFESPDGRLRLELELAGNPEAVIHVDGPGGTELAAGQAAPGRPLGGEFTAGGVPPVFGVRAPAGTRLLQAVLSAPLPPGTRRGRDFQYGAGWSDPEPTHTWTTGQAGLSIPLTEGVGGLMLEADLIPFSVPGAPPLSVSFLANDVPVGTQQLERDGWFTFRIPRDVVARSGSLHLSFKTDAAYVPADNGLGPDRRTLGVAFRRMRLRPDDTGSRGGPLP